MFRATSYGKLIIKLLEEIKSQISPCSQETLLSIKLDHIDQISESKKIQDSLTAQLAQREQDISNLMKEKSTLESALWKAVSHDESAKNRLNATVKKMHEVEQAYVELHLRGLDLKSEVERRISKIEKDINTRLGFIPTSIQNQFSLIRLLKDPGHPKYDEFRAFSMQSRSVKEKKKDKLQNLRRYYDDHKYESKDNVRQAAKDIINKWVDTVHLGDMNLPSRFEHLISQQTYDESEKDDIFDYK